MVEFIKRFVLKHEVKVPENLKYLLHQHRIKENLKGLKSMKISINNHDSIKYENSMNIVVNSPRFQAFLPSKIRQRTNSNNL